MKIVRPSVLFVHATPFPEHVIEVVELKRRSSDGD
jgi:hypothetical protein